MKKIILVGGARPNFMKIAPLYFELLKCPQQFAPLIVHTGQHYDQKMSGAFFKELGLPEPDLNLEAGSGSHAVQTAKIMIAFEEVLLKHKPDLVVVVGDVNSTLACALVAVKLKIKVAHVEAGLRSFDKGMAEEINRVVTDSISDYLFTTCEDANQNLIREGISLDQIFFVGNVMIDSLLGYYSKISQSSVLERYQLKEKEFCLLTLHRSSNVDEKETFYKIMSAIQQISKETKVIFPVHPRTKKMMEKIHIEHQKLIITEPLGYLDFLKLEENAKLVLTDSGGVQEETTFLKVPCLTLRQNTERPVTITSGTNHLVGLDPVAIIKEVDALLENEQRDFALPPLWDGKASQRIVRVLESTL
ncbi:MAG TPA: UDP-N-acetylglucosamine 2-epimerase (non-hydrolyzing) [candidate division Zixibacteria bacterium]